MGSGYRSEGNCATKIDRRSSAKDAAPRRGALHPGLDFLPSVNGRDSNAPKEPWVVRVSQPGQCLGLPALTRHALPRALAALPPRLVYFMHAPRLGFRLASRVVPSLQSDRQKRNQNRPTQLGNSTRRFASWALYPGRQRPGFTAHWLKGRAFRPKATVNLPST